MLWLDVAVLVGGLLVLTKVADLLLRPRQQRRLQAFVESLTLALSYASMIALARRLARRRLWLLVVILVALVPLQVVVSIPLLQSLFASAPGMTAERAGLLFLVLVGVELLCTVPAAYALRWVLRDDSGRWTAIRYGALLLVVVLANVAADWIVRSDARASNRLLQRALGLIELVGGSLAATLTIAAWVFALALVAHVLLRMLEAFAWRVVEYQKGAWAAVVAIATALLGMLDLYLKMPNGGP